MDCLGLESVEKGRDAYIHSHIKSQDSRSRHRGWKISDVELNEEDMAQNDQILASSEVVRDRW